MLIKVIARQRCMGRFWDKM